MVGNRLRIAILGASDPSEEGPGAAREALSAIGPGTLPAGTVILDSGGTMLKSLEAATGFDGLILIDGASMGMPAGGVGIFSLNELILPGSPPQVQFENVDIERDLLYASKFLSLPPVRIVGIQSGETKASFAGPFLDAIHEAIDQLTEEK